MKTVSVQVQRDHIESLVNPSRPIEAIAELVWNAADADASEVRIIVVENALGGIEEIRVQDDGHGMSFAEAESAFGSLGGSWKRDATRTRARERLLHGKAGRGRFRAFSLGNQVTWRTCVQESDGITTFSITGTLDNLGQFTLTDSESSADETGTTVVITDISKTFPSFFDDRAYQSLTEHFALYLKQYPELSVYFRHKKIQPSIYELRSKDYNLGTLVDDEGNEIEGELTIIEWLIPTQRALYLCDESGFALTSVQPRVRAPGFNFTSYLKSKTLRVLEDSNSLVLEELNPSLRVLLDAARDSMRTYFRDRIAEDSVDVIEQWKKEDIYPYEGVSTGVLETTQRQVFDVCALQVHEYVPGFEEADHKNKRLALRLLRHAIEHDPDELDDILENVLELPDQKRREFSQLLDRTTLSSIISASKTITDRVDFLSALEILIFNPVSKKELLERSQLHKIVEEQTWLFGEEFHLSSSDKSLNDVLEKHRAELGQDRNTLAIASPVLREDGTVGIVDLMLSRVIPQSRPEFREHLVIELKRPSQKLDHKVMNQVFSYANAVASDGQFDKAKTRWVFWAVSNEMSGQVSSQVRQRNRPEGLYYESDCDNLTVWAVTWGEIVQRCKARLKFFGDQLQLEASEDSTVAYLREMHEKYLPPSIIDALGAQKVMQP